MNNTFNKFIQELDDLTTFFKSDKSKGLINDSILQNFEDQQRKIKENADEILAENRNLRIGIIGQVKAGKSSFLNALIFDGEDVLPHAATPMTASLTKIVYAKEPYAKVVYFSKDDWNIVENRAERYDIELNRKMREWEENYRRNQKDKSLINKTINITKEKLFNNNEEEYYRLRDSYRKTVKNNMEEKLKAFKEIYEIALKSNILPDAVLGTEERVSVTDIKNDLADYVGADGTHTPFVKYIELGINNDMLAKGIEIVDTPGMGDPIISRGEATKNFLMKCDLVFILSPSPQFLNKDDIELIKNILPQDNIQHAVLLGTKFDSVLLDDSSRNRVSLRYVIKTTISKLNNQARTALSSALHVAGNNAKALKRLQEQKPQYISALLYGAGKKRYNNENFSDLENHIIQQLNNRFDGMRTDADFLTDFSNIKAVREKEFETAQKQKDIILQERRTELFNSQYITFLRQLDDIQNEAEDNLKSIKTEDIATLSQKLETNQRALVSMRRNIRTIFETCGIEVKKYLNSITVDLKDLSSQHENINIEHTTEQKRHREKHWFRKDEYWTEIIHHSEVSVSNILDNIGHYITEIEKHLSQEIKFAVDIDNIRKQIKDTVLNAFYKSNADFDENDILGPVNIVLQEITIPPFMLIDRKYYIDKVTSKFSAALVKDEQIHEIKRIQSEIFSEIQIDITNRMENIANKIKNLLDEKALSFTDDVQKQIEEKINMLTKNIQNKELSIRRYEKFLIKIKEEKNKIRAISSEMNNNK